jgi:multiple sugar transport system permease protein
MTGTAMTSAALGARTRTAPHKAARKAPRKPARTPSRVVVWVAEHTLLAAMLVLFAAPILFVALTSFMTNDQALTSALWPDPWSVESYVEAFERVPLLRWFANSALYAFLATGFMLLSSVPAAYALARLRFRAANVLFVAIVVAMLLPPQITAVPLYVMWVKGGMTGTLLPLILPNLLGDAFSIFLLRQFFLTIPREYSDAARVDGASEWGILWRVVIPMARPGIAAAGLFLFFHSWNDYYGPLLYTSENQAWWPVAFGLATFRSSHGTNWGLTMAITMLVMVPVVLIFFFAQRVFVEGITLTGVKG